jgi:hypothetical protein
VPYTSKTGGAFTILLPAGHLEETGAKPDQPIGSLTLEQPNGTFQVVYQEVPEAAGETPEQLEHRLDEYRDSVVQNTEGARGMLHGEKKVTLAGRYPGREVVVELPRQQEWVRSRFYFVGDRLYQVNASGKKWWVESREAEKVLDSFRVLPRDRARPPG